MTVERINEILLELLEWLKREEKEPLDGLSINEGLEHYGVQKKIKAAINSLGDALFAKYEKPRERDIFKKLLDLFF